MTPRDVFPDGIAGVRDFDYITPRGRRLTEYEAVTCYTQPQSCGGGLQSPGEFYLRPDGRAVFDVNSTAMKCDDWFAFRDPNQLWQRPYYSMQSQAEKSIEAATQTAVAAGLLHSVDRAWLDDGLARSYLPFAHIEYGLFATLNPAARESLSDTLNNVLVFNATDKLRHAQAIVLLGMDLEAAISGFDARVGRTTWLEAGPWQPVRRLIEEAMAVTDWCEAVVCVNLVLEPLLTDPLRRVVFSNVAARAGDPLVPLIAGTATSDWQRNLKWTQAFTAFLLEGANADHNREVLTRWCREWTERSRGVAGDLFRWLGSSLSVPGLESAALAAAEKETARLGTPVGDLVPGPA